MILNIDLAGDVPIYQQLRDRIVAAIADGVLVDGSSRRSTRSGPPGHGPAGRGRRQRTFGTTQPEDTP